MRTNDEVISFWGPKNMYGLLHNFYAIELIDPQTNITYHSSEALYQSLKFTDLQIRKRIAQEVNPYAAKRAAYEYPIQVPNWDDEAKLDAMRYTLFIKFDHVDLRSLIVDFIGKKIVEFSNKDQYWGTKPDMSGLNMLGKLLEETIDRVYCLRCLETIQQEYDELVDALIAHDIAYYVHNNPIITDEEYNRMYAELEGFEKDAKVLKIRTRTDSPIRRVGSDIGVNTRPLVKHLSFAGSIHTKIDPSIAPVLEFTSQVSKQLWPEGFGEPCYSAEPKYDGIRLTLQYELEPKDELRYFLRHVLLRGDGEVGEDVIDNARVVRSIPLSFEYYPNNPALPVKCAWISISGELTLTKSSFEEINLYRKQCGLDPYANARNAIAGIIRRVDSEMLANSGASFYPHGIDYFDEDICPIPHAIPASVSLSQLSCFGFNKYQGTGLIKNANDLFNYHEILQRERDTLEYDIDGVVYKLEYDAMRMVLGHGVKCPNWAIAHKFQPLQASATILEIIDQIGRTGVITPVAKIEPTPLTGVVISNITLHNYDEISRLDIGVGDHVFIARGGDVIPKVIGLARKKSSRAHQPPLNCPCCGASTTKFGAHYFCTNEPQHCMDRVVCKILHFAKTMEIDELGEAIVGQLVDDEYFLDIDDIYEIGVRHNTETLSVSQKQSLAVDILSRADNYGVLKAQKLVANIEKSKNTQLWRFLTAIGIPGVGAQTARNLENWFLNLDDLMCAEKDALMQVPDVGPTTAQAICDFFNSTYNANLIQNLRLSGLTWPERTKQHAALVLSGINFCITGSFTCASRDSIKQTLIGLGATIKSSVTTKVNYLLSGDDPSPVKVNAAKTYKIQILDESELKLLLSDAEAWLNSKHLTMVEQLSNGETL